MNNDRFKFRVWDITNNEYRRNSYIWTLNQIGYLTNDSMISLTSFSEEPNFEYIIEQSTGLKDKNGKLIYDRDIVKYINKATAEQFNHDMIGIIEWKATGFAITPIGAGFCGWLTQIPRGKNSFEIIGNIHDKE